MTFPDFLQLKDGVGVTIRDGLFVGMTRLEEFVSSRLPRNYPCQVISFFPFSHFYFLFSQNVHSDFIQN
jgi:hypothetical protein